MCCIVDGVDAYTIMVASNPMMADVWIRDRKRRVAGNGGQEDDLVRVFLKGN